MAGVVFGGSFLLGGITFSLCFVSLCLLVTVKEVWVVIYLVGRVASHGTDSALDHASGRVDVGLESGSTVVRHCGCCWWLK